MATGRVLAVQVCDIRAVVDYRRDVPKSEVIPASPEAYARAADIITSGGLVAFPTETVYGLAGDATNADAVDAIYRLKGRPSSNPLIVHVSSEVQARKLAEFNDVAEALTLMHWPGPLTIVLPKLSDNLAPQISAGLDTVALRCPDVDWIHQDGLTPIVMPSANVSGHVSPTRASHVLEAFPYDVLIIDGGDLACHQGVESTVVRVNEDSFTLLRPGPISVSAMEGFFGEQAQEHEAIAKGSPGLLSKHYAPKAPLRMNATSARDGEILLGFMDVKGDLMLNSNPRPKQALKDAAYNLYAMIREADAQNPTGIAIAPIPIHGLGLALNDRLRRAARGR